MTGYVPSNPHDWGTGGIKAAVNTYETLPFDGELTSRETEDDSGEIEPIPAQCIIICVTPVAGKPRRFVLVIRHGDGWLDKIPCPVCGKKALVQIKRPVETCDECGGRGHVPQQETAGHSAAREGLRQAAAILRIRKPAEDEA